MNLINTKKVQEDIHDFESKANNLLSFFKKNHVGKSKSITAKNLSEWGCPRQIRSYIHYLRMNSNPICSGSKGYWFAQSQEDVYETIKFILDPRIEEVVLALKTTLHRLPAK